jgi:hypothetical protein
VNAQGTKLIGLCDGQISFGQDRLLLVWTRLIMPNGRSIVLERQPGADTQGFAGLEDEVDQHWVGCSWRPTSRRCSASARINVAHWRLILNQSCAPGCTNRFATLSAKSGHSPTFPAQGFKPLRVAA